MTAARTPAESPARGKRARHGPVTREQILDSSLRLFSEKGFARASVRDIAQAAGITDAAIYYHFASKRDLFEALIDERGFTAALEELENLKPHVYPAEGIRLHGSQALAFLYRNRDLLKVLMIEAMADDPVATEEYRVLVQRWKKAAARILRVYAGQGLLRTRHVDELAGQIAVTVLGILADYMASAATTAVSDDDPVPPDLQCQVDAAMEHIVQGAVVPEQ